MNDTLTVYRDQRGEWRWRRKASNGRILADSAEGYRKRAHTVAMAWRCNADIDRARLDDGDRTEIVTRPVGEP